MLTCALFIIHGRLYYTMYYCMSHCFLHDFILCLFYFRFKTNESVSREMLRIIQLRPISFIDIPEAALVNIHCNTCLVLMSIFDCHALVQYSVHCVCVELIVCNYSTCTCTVHVCIGVHVSNYMYIY